MLRQTETRRTFMKLAALAGAVASGSGRGAAAESRNATPRESSGPVFVLRDVTDISVFRCKPAPDVEIDQATRREL
jgi:hypothetical protein